MALTPEQQRILEWLNVTLALPVYAEAYKGALFLLKLKPPGFVTFVAHAGREIMNGPGPTISGDQRSQVQYVQYVNKLQNEWKDEWTGRGFLTPGDPDGWHTIPYDVCQTIRDLIEEHKKGRARANQPESIFFGKLLDYEDLERAPPNFIQEWKSIKEGFLKFAHLRGSDYDEAAASILRNSSPYCSTLLERVVKWYFSSFRRKPESKTAIHPWHIRHQRWDAGSMPAPYSIRGPE